MGINNSIIGGDDIATLDNIRNGKRTVPIWIKGGGIPFVAGLEYIHKLSDVQEIAEATAELLNEREHFEGGSECIKVNDGTEWTQTITVEGNALEVVGALIGQDLNVSPVLKYGKTYARTGHLLLVSHDDTKEKNASNAMLMTDVTVKLLSGPGLTNGDTNYTISLESRGEVCRVHGGHLFSAEIFSKLDGNALAPDGVLTDFKLGDGNGSYPSPLAGVADNIIIDPDATSDLYKYFAYVKLDGVDVSPADATWTQGTKTLSFVTAPADEAILEWMWLADCATTNPAHNHAGSKFVENWKRFQNA